MAVLLNKGLNLYQTGLLYNPQLQSAEMAEKLFVVRLKQFELLLNKILQEKEDSIPQHHLVVGQRGMGKTTLLKRMEVELHKEQYRQRFIPLLYREDQYNVKDLAEFWLNTLDALADSLQSEKYPVETVTDIDKTIRELSRKQPGIISEEAHKYLMSICTNLHRRPVLLIDNIGLVFSRMGNSNENRTEQWTLRRLLSENGAPIVIAGGVTLGDDVNGYEMPFYDFFQIQHLYKLKYEEFICLLINLATVTNSDGTVFTSIQKNSSRQKSLLELTGGSPRLTVMLFEHIIKGFSSNINDDLEMLADAVTPLYKARFEELPTQQQIILDAIALNWDAISLNKLSKATRMQNNQLSPQLKRLVDDGWLETTPAYKAKGNAYFISERFFNIYYLIRNSSRRHKDKIYCLSRFLECFYGKEELGRIADFLLKQDIHSAKEMQLQMAFWNIEPLDKNKRQLGLENMSKAFLESEELRKEFDIPKDTILLAEGSKLLFEEKYEDAIRCFKDVLESNKNSEITRFIHYIIGDILRFSGQYEDAINSYDKVLEINPENSSASLKKGYILTKLGQYEKAIICYDEAIEAGSGDSDDMLFFSKAHCLSMLDINEKSLDCINKAIELKPEDEYYLASKGVILNSLAQFEESLNCFEQAIGINPEYGNFWYGKGQVLFSLKRYEESINALEKAIELDTNNKYIWYWKAECFSELERYEEAIECYDRAIKMDDNYKIAWSSKGFALIELKHYDEAVLAYEKSSLIEPKDLLPKFHLLFLYRDKLDEMDKAIELINSITEEDLNNDENKEVINCFYLNKAVFELYKRNEGLAKEHMLQAFEVLEKEDKLSSTVNKYLWMRFTSVVIKLGYYSWLLGILQENGYDIVLSPYYTAIKALEIENQDSKNGKENAEIFLKNIAIEISTPAQKIMDKIRRYIP